MKVKVKISELQGTALDWAVAKCEGWDFSEPSTTYCWQIDSFGATLGYEQHNWLPSTDWSQGGPIIEREKIVVSTEYGNPWRARFGRARITFDGRAHHYHHEEGQTPLIAAMRCYVASKLGDEVEVPDELL